MSAKLFSCLFECDAMHPTRMCDFATYTPSQVWPGVDLFGDRYRYSLSLCHLNPLHYFHVSRTSTFNLSPCLTINTRCNSRAMLEALEFASSELVVAGYPLEALPVLSLYEHVARDAAKSTTHAVHARVLRSKALMHLGFLAEAFKQLRSLQLGQGLPKVSFDSDVGNSIFPSSDDASFSNQLPATHECNLRALQILSDTTLVKHLAHTTCTNFTNRHYSDPKSGQFVWIVLNRADHSWNRRPTYQSCELHRAVPYHAL